MELYLGLVPDDTVWVVHVDHGWGAEAYFWFLTSEASTQTYRDEERILNFKDPEMPIVLTRWEVKLPKRNMERDDVDIHVEKSLLEGESETCRRLDIRATKIK